MLSGIRTFVLLCSFLFLLQFTYHMTNSEKQSEDLYDDLGLTFQATSAEIKKAYRKLSLKYHPDKNIGDAIAANAFQKVALAYEILSNDENRQTYDLDGMEGVEAARQRENQPASPFDSFFGGGGGGGGKQRGQDAGVTVEVTLEDLFNGAERKASFQRNSICPKCRGTGAKDGKTKPCKTCAGQGHVVVNRRMGGFNMQMQQPCSTCSGRGKVPKKTCPHCSGHKVVKEDKVLTAEIEKGMPSDHKIVFEKESEQSPGVVPGDVVFMVKQKAHGRFRRQGNDLHYDMEISLKEALLGYSTTIQQLDESQIPVKKGGITTPFEITKLKGHGMPYHNYPSQHGNMIIQHKIKFPKSLSPQQIEAVKAMFPGKITIANADTSDEL